MDRPTLLYPLILLLGLMLSGTALHAQRLDERSIAEGRQILETRLEALLADMLIDNTSAELALEQYDDLARAPRDLNSITLDELLTFPLINEYLAQQLMLYRTNHHGRFTSLYDLKMIPGWTDEVTSIYMPLLYLDPQSLPATPRLSTLLERGRWHADLLFTRPIDPDRLRSTYIGSPESLDLRWRWTSMSKLSAMIAMQKDSYEPWHHGAHRGFDSYSGHLSTRRLGIIRQAVLGDYRIHWGEGLLIRQGYSPRTLLGSLGRTTEGIRPVAGSTESDFSRGIALSFDLGRWELSAFGSWRTMDGRIDTATHLIYALDDTGLRRTERDWSRRGAVPSQLLGTQLAFTHRRLRLALSALGGRWGGYQLRHATGASTISDLDSLGTYGGLSLSYGYQSRRGNAFASGEVARSYQGAWAVLQRLGLRSDDLGEWQLALRYIDPTYWNYHAQSYTHYRRAGNEIGLSMATILPSLIRRLTISAEGDLYHSIQPRGSLARGEGFRLRSTLAYSIGLEHTLRLSASITRRTDQAQSHRYTLGYDARLGTFSLSPQISLSHSLDLKRQDASRLSYALGLRGSYAPCEWLRLRSSLYYYSVDQWDDRLYLPEIRLSRQWVSTFAYGQGLRLSATLDARLSRSLSLGLYAMHHWRRAPHASRSHLALQLSVR